MLLSQPEILKRMSSLNKLPKGTEDSNSYLNKFKKDQVKKQMKMKVDYAAHTQNREVQIKTVMNQVQKSDANKNAENIVNKELFSQEENFKKRLEEKRKKSLLSTSDITDIREKRHHGSSKDIGKDHNRSFINFNLQNELTRELENESGMNLSFTCHKDHIEDNFNQNFLQDLENSLNEIDKKEININIDNDISFDTPTGDISAFQKSQISGNRIKTSKQKQIFGDIKSIIDNFLGEFNYYFFDDVFSTVVEDIQKLLEEKHSKTLEISKSYNNQIKEYEFLISTGIKFFNCF